MHDSLRLIPCLAHIDHIYPLPPAVFVSYLVTPTLGHGLTLTNTSPLSLFYLVTSLLLPQAMAMVDRQDATVHDIDISMQLGAGHPMGPLHLAGRQYKEDYMLTTTATGCSYNSHL